MKERLCRGLLSPPPRRRGGGDRGPYLKRGAPSPYDGNGLGSLALRLLAIARGPYGNFLSRGLRGRLLGLLRLLLLRQPGLPAGSRSGIARGGACAGTRVPGLFSSLGGPLLLLLLGRPLFALLRLLLLRGRLLLARPLLRLLLTLLGGSGLLPGRLHLHVRILLGL